PMVPHLAGAGHILAVDFRGHGQSSAVPSFSYEDGVADVGAVVDGLGLERPVVVGHSLGGMIASIYTARSGAPGALVNADGHGAGHPSQFDGIPPDEIEAALDKFATMSVESFNAVVDR